MGSLEPDAEVVVGREARASSSRPPRAELSLAPFGGGAEAPSACRPAPRHRRPPGTPAGLARCDHRVVVGVVCRLVDQRGRSVVSHGVLGAAHPGAKRLHKAEREEHVLELGVHVAAPVEALPLVEVLDGHGRQRPVVVHEGHTAAYT